MRKAFDANVPKLRPRLKNGAGGADGAGSDTLPLPEPAGAADTASVHAEPPSVGATATATVTPTPTAIATATSTPTATATSTPTDPVDGSAVHPERSASVEADARSRRAPTRSDRIRAALSEQPPAAAEPATASSDVLDRKERLEKIKRKVAEAARPTVRPGPTPTDPARAAESVLGLVHDLEAELVNAREREDALRLDLDEARKELGRTSADGRAAAERLAGAEKDLEERRGVLAEMLEEMQALEDERDESVRRAQALAALDEERARLLEEVTRRAEEEAKLRAEREAEVERLSEELRATAQDGARLRAAVGELARERDQLAAEVERARKERDDLAAAKRALEQVHAALAQARARIG